MNQQIRNDSKPSQQVLDMLIGRLGLSVRARKALSAAGLCTVRDIHEKSSAQLREIKSLGERGLKELRECLSYVGVKLPEDHVAAPQASQLKDKRAVGIAALTEVETTPRGAGLGEAPLGGRHQQQHNEDSMASRATKQQQHKSRANRKPVTEADRASTFVRTHAEIKNGTRQRKGPNLSDPTDLARIRELRNTVTMEVEEAGWLYGLSRAASYAAANSGRIPTKVFNDRLKVVTESVFKELFPNLPHPLETTGANFAEAATPRQESP